MRKCEAKDLPQLVELCAKHAKYEQATYCTSGKYLLLKDALFTEHAKLHCFVIESRSKVQGYFSYTFDFSTWDAQQYLYLDCLYLEPDFRGQKVGERVFDKLKEIASQSKCVNIQWQTPVFNTRAIGFYHRIGGIEKEKARFTLNF